ncbi:MAG: dephospho-CoA kinase [Rhodospirillaceae bacterium]|nr:dephospho-CoA kinase [Rhodospirillaceae bacterium]MBL6930376.1 dephospho-CoA kinase [Rhodospirillales bacterium]MBL6941147.1 dephospho-CoA kinase [Rhodospirillales bacterium]
MIILGLTGSIGMGKTTAAMAFRSLGVFVHDADKAVHSLMAPGGGATAAVLDAFPGVEKDGGVDRKALGALVFGKPAKLQQLEKILHPLVRQKQTTFLATSARRRQKLVVLDIPLLFETGGHARCDGVVVVSAPALIQKQRVMARPGMTKKRFDSILNHQMADQDKRRMADFVVLTGLSRHHGLRQIANIVTVTKAWKPRQWSARNNSKRMIMF